MNVYRGQLEHTQATSFSDNDDNKGIVRKARKHSIC